MHVIGSRGTATRTVIEHHEVGKTLQNLVHFTIVSLYRLRLMLQRRDSEMMRKNRERVEKQLEARVYLLRHLLGRTVFLTKETRTFLD